MNPRATDPQMPAAALATGSDQRMVAVMDDRASAPPTMSQDQAVIGWLATRPALPDLTRLLLIDALIFWESLAPLPAVTAQPGDREHVDIDQLLSDINGRLQAHPCHPGDLHGQMVLADVHHLLGLARYSLLDPDGARAGRARKELGLSWATQLRVLETDTAVELALADQRRRKST